MVEEEQELVSSKEQEENPEERDQGHPLPRGLRDWPPLPPLRALEALAVLQEELSCGNEKYCGLRRKYFQLRRKNHQRKRLHLSQKSTIIQSISGFWGKGVSSLTLLRVHCSGGGVCVRPQASRGKVQGKWGLGGMASFKGTVPAVPRHGSTCVCLSHDSG